MKKLFAIILCMLICFSLTACGGSPINGTWKYSLNGDTSIVKFKGEDKVVWTMEEDGESKTIEGKFSYDAENEEVTVVLEGWGSGTYDVDLSIPQIDFVGLPHRK